MKTNISFKNATKQECLNFLTQNYGLRGYKGNSLTRNPAYRDIDNLRRECQAQSETVENKRSVTNLYTKEVLHFDTDQEFLEYACKTYHENEDTDPFGPSTIHFLPECIENAVEYISE